MSSRKDRLIHWIDVSVPIRPGMIAYPGDPAVTLEPTASLDRGDDYNLARLSLGTHTGTHIDAPAHFIAGAPGIESLDPDTLIGPAWVADATAVREHLDPAVLEALEMPPGCMRLVLKTMNSALWNRPSFDADYVALTVEGARWLVARGVRVVAIDYLSIATFDDPAPVHLTLLAAGVVIVEGLDLRAVSPGEYTLACLPLLIPGADGAPARVLLGSTNPRP